VTRRRMIVEKDALEGDLWTIIEKHFDLTDGVVRWGGVGPCFLSLLSKLVAWTRATQRPLRWPNLGLAMGLTAPHAEQVSRTNDTTND
jgi:hypothetical protein